MLPIFAVERSKVVKTITYKGAVYKEAVPTRPALTFYFNVNGIDLILPASSSSDALKKVRSVMRPFKSKMTRPVKVTPATVNRLEKILTPLYAANVKNKDTSGVGEDFTRATPSCPECGGKNCPPGGCLQNEKPDDAVTCDKCEGVGCQHCQWKGWHEVNEDQDLSK